MDGKRVYILGAGASKGHSKKSQVLFPLISDFFDRARELEVIDKADLNALTGFAEHVLGESRRIDIEALLTHMQIEIDRYPNPKEDLLLLRQRLLDMIKLVLIRLAQNVVVWKKRI